MICLIEQFFIQKYKKVTLKEFQHKTHIVFINFLQFFGAVKIQTLLTLIIETPLQ
jgi:hypothetical protein